MVVPVILVVVLQLTMALLRIGVQSKDPVVNMTNQKDFYIGTGVSTKTVQDQIM